ncbi:20856_t:CDS:2 [Dentiscutata erythropus]|uniref:20856_t:CDS:1 n=1 Tax=Dentiscutata erythropus TaxID=1348616 RepID=A0A9N9BWR2_9GLOM|nr:20856_t:CDS:2 [Dentiscutata erythropus]
MSVSSTSKRTSANMANQISKKTKTETNRAKNSWIWNYFELKELKIVKDTSENIHNNSNEDSHDNSDNNNTPTSPPCSTTCI